MTKVAALILLAGILALVASPDMAAERPPAVRQPTKLEMFNASLMPFTQPDENCATRGKDRLERSR